MRIAIPLESGKLAGHFGHCEQFLFAEVDPNTRQVLTKTVTTPPDHAPGVFPKWLAQHGTNVVIAGSIGTHARNQLAVDKIQLYAGVTAAEPDVVIAVFLDGTLQTSDGGCDHSKHGCSH